MYKGIEFLNNLCSFSFDGTPHRLLVVRSEALCDKGLGTNGQVSRTGRLVGLGKKVGRGVKLTRFQAGGEPLTSPTSDLRHTSLPRRNSPTFRKRNQSEGYQRGRGLPFVPQQFHFSH